jgi:hypothetical protein
MKHHTPVQNAGASPPHQGAQTSATGPVPPVRWATPAAPMQPKMSGAEQTQRSVATIPPVRIPLTSASGQQRMTGAATQGETGNAIPPVRMAGNTHAVQPKRSGAAMPQRAAVPIPPVRMLGAAGYVPSHMHTAVQPQSPAPKPPPRPVVPIPLVRRADEETNRRQERPGVAQPQRSAVPIPPVRMPGATGIVQPQTSSLGGVRLVTDTGQPNHPTRSQKSFSANQGMTGAAPGERVHLNFLSTQANLSGNVPIHVGTASREQAIQRAKGFWGGLVGGAALGTAVAGPAGGLVGAIGGAVLGPVFEWWNNLPAQDPLPFTAANLNAERQNLRHIAGPVPYTPPPNTADQMLVTGRQNLRHTAGPVPRAFQVNTADLINTGNLAVGRQNLRHTAGPVPYTPPPNTADQMLVTGRQNLAHTQIEHQLDTVEWPDAGWQFTVPFDPVVVHISEQTKGKRLDEMILLPQGVRLGRVLFCNAHGQALPGNTILGAGCSQIRYRYQTTSGQMSAPRATMLHIKPAIDDLMDAMGFVSIGWRWELSWGTHGTLGNDFHLSVPKALQSMPDRMDDNQAILKGLFPEGGGLTGTHMSIECRMAEGAGGMNNAAYFLNGNPKYPKGYTQQEQEQFVNACKTRLAQWKQGRAQSLQTALKTL